MKLACVIQRFGPDLAGGSERHCRLIAERLAEGHDVTILTSCADDYVTWRNVHAPGISRLGRLSVRRFPIARQRRQHRFVDLSEIVFSRHASLDDQEAWFRENGPQVPDLLAHLEQHGRQYDLILFWSYRYYQSFFGLPIVADRAVLVPTAEADPLIQLDILDRFFALPAGYMFLTPEEADLVAMHSSQPLPPSCIIGCGVEPARTGESIDLERFGVRSPFLLYLGRIERNKGCETLLRYFNQYLDREGKSVQLVMAGPANLPLPAHPSVKWLGVVNDSLRDALLREAGALAMPSPFESLSMVLLEAWNHALPALVNGHCKVLKGQVLRADGGLYYRNANEFAAALKVLLERRDLARRLGRQGLAYVDREYRWPAVLRKVEGFLLDRLAQRATVPTAVSR
jgi:glycosyltransferase involved in cell wall biosynthesis